MAAIQTSVVTWFAAHGRELPWRRDHAAKLDERLLFWHVLLSEIMSQQTRLATVLPFYERWLGKWPTLESFAAATEEEVLAAWQGLGYYRRAKNLHACARKIVNELGGRLPRTAKALEDLPGVGPYTAGAVASSVFGESAAIVDGNVTRVLCRLRAIAAEPSKASKTVWALSRQLVPATSVYAFNQGLMDLGSTVCTPKTPRCAECPLQTNCRAFALERAAATTAAAASASVAPTTAGDIEDLCTVCSPDAPAATQVTAFPLKAVKAKQRVEHIAVAVVHLADSDDFLLQQRPAEGILAKMWEFSQVVVADGRADCSAALDALLRDRCGIDTSAAYVASRRHVGAVAHELSHVKQTFHVEHVVLRGSVAVPARADVRLFPRAALRSSAISQGNLKCLALAEAPAETASSSSSASTKRRKKKDDGAAPEKKPRPSTKQAVQRKK